MDQKILETTIHKIVNSIFADTTYKTEFDAYFAIYDTERTGNQFENLAWIMKTQEGEYAICPGVLELFNMKTEREWFNNILRPALSPLFAESFSILEPKIVYRNLDVPMLILDPVSSDDLMNFEEDNKALTKLHPNLIKHKIYYDTGHNIHYEKKEQFIKDVIDFLRKVKSCKD